MGTEKGRKESTKGRKESDKKTLLEKRIGEKNPKKYYWRQIEEEKNSTKFYEGEKKIMLKFIADGEKEK